jgi:hypothetical protein
MNLQSALNTSTLGIIAQGGPAIQTTKDGQRACRYRTREGHRCAIGQLIPDVLYSEDLENFSVDTSSILSILGLTTDDTTEIDFLTRLQSAHDSAATSNIRAFWPVWRRKLRDLCYAFHLDPTILDVIPNP